jgi:hypothetical protein
MRVSRENTGQACGATKHTCGRDLNSSSGRPAGAAPLRNVAAAGI